MHVLTVLCAGGWMSAHLSEGWRRLGCTVTEFRYGTHMGAAWDAEGRASRRAVNARLLQTARALHAQDRLDLVFAVIYDDVLDVDTARALRRLDVPLVNYHVDLVGQWYRVLRTGRYFDVLACAQRVHWSGLRRAGIRPMHLPMAANPPRDNGVDASRRSFDGVLYLGSPWPFRREVLRTLARASVPIRVMGRNWDRRAPDPANAQPARKLAHDLRHYFLPRARTERATDLLETVQRRVGALARRSAPTRSALPEGVLAGAYEGEDFADLVRGAAVNLGFTHFRGSPGSATERRQLRLRDYEIPMLGGFYLTQWCEELPEAYEEGREVAVWRSEAELVELARYFLAHPAARQEIAARGRERCARDHTWEARFRQLLHSLGLSAPRPAAFGAC